VPLVVLSSRGRRSRLRSILAAMVTILGGRYRHVAQMKRSNGPNKKMEIGRNIPFHHTNTNTRQRQPNQLTLILKYHDEGSSIIADYCRSLFVFLPSASAYLWTRSGLCKAP
jgi:hypothetical protein